MAKRPTINLGRGKVRNFVASVRPKPSGGPGSKRRQTAPKPDPKQTPQPNPTPSARREAPVLNLPSGSDGDINEFPTGGGNVPKGSTTPKAAETATKTTKMGALGRGAGMLAKGFGVITTLAIGHEILRGLGIVDWNRTSTSRKSFGDIGIEAMIETLRTGEVRREMEMMPVFRELASARRSLDLQRQISAIGGDADLQSAIRSRSPKLIAMAQSSRKGGVGELMDDVLARTGARVVPTGIMPESEVM